MPSDVDKEFNRINEEMFKEYFEMNPEVATYFGLHDPYDYLLSEGTTLHLKENLEFMERWIRQLEDEIDLSQLNSLHRIDLKALRMWLELNRFSFHDHQIHERNPDAFRNLGGLFFIMFARDYMPLEKRIDAIAARLGKVPKYLEEFRSRFEKSRPVKLWTEIALERAELFPVMFEKIINTTEGDVSKEIHRKLEEAFEGLKGDLDRHVEWLRDLLPRAKGHWALGKEKFEKLIQIRRLGLSLNEIRELGTKYLRKLKDKRLELAKKIIPGGSVDEVMKEIEIDAPRTFEEALEVTRREILRARDFIKKRKLAKVHVQDVLEVRETSHFMAVLTPFAALFMPGKFDEPQVGVYVVTRPKEKLGKHLNYSSIKNTAIHEAFPGHFIQGSVSNRGELVRLLVHATESVEGWAHYCEQMIREQGFLEDLRTRFVQVNDGIWRAVRAIVDVGLSLGEIGFDEAVEMLVKEVGMSRKAAASEVRRYTMTPGYALSYMIGKHLILQLRDEIKEKMGNRYSDRVFHDTIISNGYLPISLLREIFAEKLRDL